MIEFISPPKFSRTWVQANMYFMCSGRNWISERGTC